MTVDVAGHGLEGWCVVVGLGPRGNLWAGVCASSRDTPGWSGTEVDGTRLWLRLRWWGVSLRCALGSRGVVFVGEEEGASPNTVKCC